MRPKVLLVEDEMAIQLTIKSYLEPKFDVVAVKTAVEAADWLAKCNFRVILIDLGLPDASGHNVIKAAVRDHKRAVILVLTGDKSADSVRTAVGEGVDDYLIKPIMNTKLHERIAHAVAKRKLPPL